MADKDYKAFIVEGEAREPLIIENISKVFFQRVNFKIITLPAGQNIYMLWKKLKEDDFDTDIIEVLREEHEELKEQLEGINREDSTITYEQYTEAISPFAIYKMEEKVIHEQWLFVLSAFPEFLLDYFGVKLWRTCVKHTEKIIKKEECPKI